MSEEREERDSYKIRYTAGVIYYVYRYVTGATELRGEAEVRGKWE